MIFRYRAKGCFQPEGIDCINVYTVQTPKFMYLQAQYLILHTVPYLGSSSKRV